MLSNCDRRRKRRREWLHKKSERKRKKIVNRQIHQRKKKRKKRDEGGVGLKSRRAIMSTRITRPGDHVLSQLAKVEDAFISEGRRGGGR